MPVDRVLGDLLAPRGEMQTKQFFVLPPLLQHFSAQEVSCLSRPYHNAVGLRHKLPNTEANRQQS